MNELFKNLYQDKELPENIKKEVMKSYDTFKLMSEITDLFTDKFVKTEVEFLTDINDSESKTNNEM